ncbi:Fic family protein [Bradyrhizobium vignae]|uniref:Fic family protein n=1 Tax=Bradyrhizobium vignae TaxID=1549949 RepID=A0ABS3ZYJ4_9BRAD|nr:Fic family protein [Bradyrhizobium vignae]MBP0112815.1 Fic family protein [Bradyrhizobium vignae]
MTGVAAMEPMLPDLDPGLGDQVLSLVEKSSSFSGSLNASLKASVGDIVRALNCYYSNLIEGHDTHLADIERAMRSDYSKEPKKRDLQLEARAHIEVQRMIDRGEMPFPALSAEGIRWIHREFCDRLPDNLLRIDDPVTGETIRMIPGELRTRHVKVRLHVAPDPGSVPALLARFVQAYSSPMLSRTQRILGVGAGHHRLAWIHPFMDGNGRVMRLQSHAVLKELGIGSELWSVSRGLARQVGRYKELLQAADEPRRGPLDGRGSLTESGLAEFCRFFLDVCIHQIDFMRSLLDPAEFTNRVETWAKEEVRAKRLPKGAWRLLREAILVGEFPRSRATDLTGYQERQARTVLSDLVDKGLLVSDTPKGPVRLGFPSTVIERWLPGLYQSNKPGRG